MKINEIKAWKSEEYRSTLTQEQLDNIKNPAGDISLTNEEMQNVGGGTFTCNDTSNFLCGEDSLPTFIANGRPAC